jgi:hydrogenase nickel incorporation protein HypA/HybF
MHELSVTESILSTVLQTAEKHGVTKIIRIHLEIGELNDLKGEWIQHFFDYLSKDTIAEDAEIEVHVRPTRFTCHSCQEEFPLELNTVKKVSCPSCGSGDCTLTDGSGFFIRDMEAV